MSIELDVKLGTQQIAKADFTAKINWMLQTRFNCSANTAWTDTDASFETLGERPCSFTISLPCEADVACLIFSPGLEEEIGDEGGWWANVAVAARTRASLLLMLVVAASIAELASSKVIDDALILQMGREVSPDDLNAVILPHEDESLPEVATRVAQALGLR